MIKLTVSEYATEFNTSVQSVYQRIKRGSLKSVEENGIKYVITDDSTGSKAVKSILKPSVESDCKDLLKLIKSQQKEIKRLTKELTTAQNGKSEVLEKFIFEMQKQIPAPIPKEEDVIDIPESKKKKSKKKKKGKK